MALDPMNQEIVDETFKLLKEAPFTHDALVRISPRRMRAIQLFAQQKVQIQMNGKMITLQEEADAPELSAEISDILGFDKLSDSDVKPDITNDAELQEFLAWKAAAERVRDSYLAQQERNNDAELQEFLAWKAAKGVAK